MKYLFVAIGVLLCGVALGTFVARAQVAPAVPHSDETAAPVARASAAPSDPTAADPGPPPWVKADGTIDRAKLPACLMQADEHGNPRRDAAGKIVCLDPDKVYGLPPLDPNAVDGHGQPVTIPAP